MKTIFCPRTELVLVDLLTADLQAVDTLLGLALVKVEGKPRPPVAVYRGTDRRLLVAMPVDAAEFAVPWAIQRQLARLVRRHVRRLERAS